jgi:hypothetical protein
MSVTSPKNARQRTGTTCRAPTGEGCRMATKKKAKSNPHGSAMLTTGSFEKPNSNGCGTRRSVLDEFAQPPESVIPLPGDQIKVAADLLEALLIQLPDALPAAPSATHETRVLHDAQVFGDCLTRHVEASGQPRNGRRPIVTEAGDQPQAGFVSQRREEWRRIEQLRHRPWTTPPAQGISRSASRPYPSLARWPGMPLPGAPAGFDRSRIR